MSRLAIPIENAVPLRRTPGTTVTIVNQLAVDVYFDENPNRLNASLAGVVPEGTKITASGGQIQWVDFPGVVWFRSAVATFLEVQA